MTARALLAVFAVSALTGCGAAAAHPPRTARRAADATPFARIRKKPDGRTWLRADSRRARQAGAGSSKVITVGAGAAGDRIEGMVGVPADQCVLLLARASSSVEDVDLFAYGENGATLGTDEAPDDKPTLLVCPPHPRHVYLVARIAAGHGLVAIGAQLVSRKDAARVGKALAARGRPGEAAGRAQDWPGLEEKLARHRRLIGATWTDVRRVAVPVEPSVPTRVSAMVQAGRCLDVLVLPSDEVSHVGVDVLDQEARIVGRARASGRDRSLVLCSPTTEPVTIEVRPHAGRGLVAVVLSQSGPSAARDLLVPALRFDLAPVGDLAAARRALAARLEHAGYEQARLIGRGTLQVGRRASLALRLTKGCARVDVIAGRPAHGVKALLWAHDGSLIASNSGGPGAVLFVCSHGGQARLDVEATTRPGPYAVELRREGDTPAVLLDHPLAASRLLARMTERGVIQRASQLGAAKVVQLSPTKLYRTDVLVPVGRCVDLTLALGAGATGAELRLVDTADNKEIALSRGVEATSGRACALDAVGTLHARAELRATVGHTAGLFATRMLTPHR